MVAVSPAPGLVALLDNDDTTLQVFALTKLNAVVDQVWPDVSDEVTAIEVLYEDESFPQRELAALVASKVYYHLGDYIQSTSYALGAGKLFNIDTKDEYVETIISQCIDSWVSQTRSIGNTKVDPRLVDVVDRMLQRCFDDHEYKQAIGIALEARQRSLLIRIFEEAKDDTLLQHVLDVTIETVHDLEFRRQVLTTLLDAFKQQVAPDYLAIVRCIIVLDDANTAAGILSNLLSQNDDVSLLTAYQMAFDLESSATQQFLQRVAGALKAIRSSTSSEKQLTKILSGEVTIRLYLSFLQRNDRSDVAILDKIKDSLEARNSIFHSGVTFCNAFMHAGTTSDGFFRNNLDWLSKASNWSKFSATAALGVIHKGNLRHAATLLGPYLPKESGRGSAYSEGGSLYALGLIHANHGAPVLQQLLREFGRTTDEVIQHGAALGLGVAGMATADDNIYESLKNVLFGDSAVAGEATGLAMGLVMLGTNSQQAIEEMLQYAHETQHEKIVRGLAMGLALLVYGREREADTLIEQLCKDDDPQLRYGGMYAIALAYSGTGHTQAFERLLHFAVADVHDDVRRAAVTALGFVMYRNQQTLCRTIGLLHESYNPHVRYGAAMALGIACAGTASPDALELIEPMTKDATEFVRQGAFIALAMILVQHNDQTNPKVVEARKLFRDTISNKHQDAVSKFGASLASGILDAGGRNVTMRLSSATGSNNRQAIVGMAVFTSFWYWFPLAHFLSLAFTPTAIVALDTDLRAPKLQFVSNSKPSAFAYPPVTTKEENKAAEKVATAVLSTTARAKARAKKAEKEKTETEDIMDLDDKPAADEASLAHNHDRAKPAKSSLEPGFEHLDNLSRVVPWQLKHIAFKPDARYLPVRRPTGGVLLMRDTQPDAPREFVELLPEPPEIIEALDEQEAAVPSEFEYPFDNE
ncbi:proteasome regulatory particle base subunit [Savitreella phatthalungensis]